MGCIEGLQSPSHPPGGRAHTPRYRHHASVHGQAGTSTHDRVGSHSVSHSRWQCHCAAALNHRPHCIVLLLLHMYDGCNACAQRYVQLARGAFAAALRAQSSYRSISAASSAAATESSGESAAGWGGYHVCTTMTRRDVRVTKSRCWPYRCWALLGTRRPFVQGPSRCSSAKTTDRPIGKEGDIGVAKDNISLLIRGASQLYCCLCYSNHAVPYLANEVTADLASLARHIRMVELTRYKAHVRRLHVHCKKKT